MRLEEAKIDRCKRKPSEAERLFLLARHFERLNTRRSLERAAQLYSQAAELGHLESMFRLSLCYWLGVGVDKSRKRAHAWCQRCAESGHADAIYELAFAYDQGLLSAVNEGLAEFWYRKGIELGEPECMAQFARILNRRNDYEAGLALLRRSADLGSPAGLSHWGSYKLHGDPLVEMDVGLGAELLFRARDKYWTRCCASNHRPTEFLAIGCWGLAEAYIGGFVLEGRFGIRDLISIVRMLRRGFLSNDKTSHIVPLGDALLEMGEVAGARAYWRRAERLGDTQATEKLRLAGGFPV